MVRRNLYPQNVVITNNFLSVCFVFKGVVGNTTPSFYFMGNNQFCFKIILS